MSGEHELERSVKAAEQMSRDPRAVELITEQAQAKARRAEHKLKGLRKDLDSLVRLARAWATGKYKDVSFASILVVIGAVVYFVNPFDAVPDFLPLIGLTDDISVIALAVGRVRKELDKFDDWEREITLK